MAILSRESLLGASDLTEREVELPTIGGSVRVRSLPAAYSNLAQSEALEMITVQTRSGPQQTAHINTVKLEALQVLHALIDPKLSSIEEVHTFSQQCGSAWRTLVAAIDEISGIDKEAIEKTNALFRSDDAGSGGPSGPVADSAGDGRSDVRVPAGA